MVPSDALLFLMLSRFPTPSVARLANAAEMHPQPFSLISRKLHFCRGARAQNAPRMRPEPVTADFKPSDQIAARAPTELQKEGSFVRPAGGAQKCN